MTKVSIRVRTSLRLQACTERVGKVAPGEDKTPVDENKQAPPRPHDRYGQVRHENPSSAAIGP